MNATDFLTDASLIVLLANVLDWWFKGRRRFLWTPQERGLARYLWWTCYGAVAVTIIGIRLGWLPLSIIPWVLLPLFNLLNLGFIWARHTTKQPLES